ncbi:MAG: hypothetical protein H0V82_11700 [Candidatus Protochlamydia sp.]|nr:hypothetical protein [Candidatus Protochlamydia sp.]
MNQINNFKCAFTDIQSLINVTPNNKDCLTEVWINYHTGHLSAQLPIHSSQNWYLTDLAHEFLLPIEETASKIKSLDSLPILPEFKEEHLTTDFSKLTCSHPQWVYETQMIHLKEVIKKASDCFQFEIIGLTYNDVAKEVFSLVNQRLSSKEPLNVEEITQFHHLLSMLNQKSPESLSQEFIQLFIIIQKLQSSLDLYSNDRSLSLETTGGDNQFAGINSSYILRGKEGERSWVFKPEKGESGFNGTGTVLCEGIQPGKGAKREHVASLVNYHGKFPIPYTSYVDLCGSIGSVQIFEPGCKPLPNFLDDESNPKKLKQIPIEALQSMVLFDTLFGNCDRRADNVLYRPRINEETGKDEIQLFAIDHGACMSASFDDPLKMDLLALPMMITGTYTQGLKDLIFNENNEEKNALIMREHGIEELAIEWMSFVSQFLRWGLSLSEEYKQNNGVELSPADLAIVILKNRKLLWEIHLNSSDEKFEAEQYIKDILEYKVYLKKLQNEETDLNDLESIRKNSRKCKTIMRSFIHKSAWMDNIFEYIIKPNIEEILKEKECIFIQ